MISNPALTFHALMVLGHVNVTDGSFFFFFCPGGNVVEWNKENVLNTASRIRSEVSESELSGILFHLRIHLYCIVFGSHCIECHCLVIQTH